MIPNRLSNIGQKLPLVPGLYFNLKRLIPFFPDNLTDEQKQFIRENSRKWQESDRRQEVKSHEYVLVNITTSNPTAVAALCMSGKYLAYGKHARTLFLLLNRFNTPLNRICMSYHPDACVYFNDKDAGFDLRRKAHTEAQRMFQNLSKPENILTLESEGLLVGDLIYDTYLTTHRSGTIPKLDVEVFRLIKETVHNRRYFERIFKAFPITAVMVSSPVYNVFGLLARVALKREIEAYTTARWTLSSLRIRRYRSLAEIRTHDGRPSEALVNTVRQHYRDKALREAENYLQKLLNPATPAPDGAEEFNPYHASRKTLSREELVRALDIEPDKPIAVIMSHALTDAVHLGNWMLFNDYLTWLRETLSFARDNPSVNWLVKSHPAAAKFQGKDNEKNEVLSA
ncbi:hypothetical protein ACFLWN_01355, partial [Chloroflexota bacterium]